MNPSRKHRKYNNAKNPRYTMKWKGINSKEKRIWKGTQWKGTQWKGGEGEEEKPKESNVNMDSNDPAVQQIKQQVADENNLSNYFNLGNLGDLGDSEIIQKSAQLAEGVTLNTLDTMGKFVGVDLEDPASLQQKIDNLKQTLSNPETTQKLMELGGIAVEATAPFTKPLIEKSVEAGKEALSEMGEAGVKVLLNTAEEIPGVGVLIGTIRSISNIAEAAISSINAGSEVIKSSSDTINESTKYFNQLVKEKTDVLNRTSDSVNEFTQGGGGLQKGGLQKGGLLKGGSRKRTQTKKVRKYFF